MIPPGLLPEATFGSEAAVEIRFPTNLRILDRLGSLAHTLDDIFHDVSVTPQSHLELRFDDSLSHLSGERALFLQSSGEAVDSFLLRVRSAWSLAAAVLEITEVERVGVRSGFVVAVETVEDAVHTFRHSFFDYYRGCLADMGKPVEVQVVARFDQWSLWQGVPLSCSIRMTPIHVLPRLQEILQEYDHRGALLMDLDRYAVGPLDQNRATELVEFALAAGIASAGELSRRLRVGKEAITDDATSADSA